MKDEQKITSQSTRSALMLALLIEQCDGEGNIRLNSRELVDLLIERRIFNTKQNMLALGRELHRLEAAGILTRVARVPKTGRGARMGMHFWWRLCSRSKISRMLSALPEIKEKDWLNTRLQGLALDEKDSEAAE